MRRNLINRFKVFKWWLFTFYFTIRSLLSWMHYNCVFSCDLSMWFRSRRNPPSAEPRPRWTGPSHARIHGCSWDTDHREKTIYQIIGYFIEKYRLHIDYRLHIGLLWHRYVSVLQQADSINTNDSIFLVNWAQIASEHLLSSVYCKIYSLNDDSFLSSIWYIVKF